MATPTPCPPTDPPTRKMNRGEKGGETRVKSNKMECDIFTPEQCVHTNPCTPNQPIHYTALKEDRK